MLEELQARLGRLGRPHTAADVATAMRGMGLVVSDTALREAMDQLRRNSVGAGPLEDGVGRRGRPGRQRRRWRGAGFEAAAADDVRVLQKGRILPATG